LQRSKKIISVIVTTLIIMILVSFCCIDSIPVFVDNTTTPTTTRNTYPETTASTTSTTSSIQTSQESDNEPDIDPNHGSAVTLEGKIIIVSIFANDSSSNWKIKSSKDKNLMKDTIKNLKTATKYLSKQAKRYNKKLSFVYDWAKNDDLVYYADFDINLVNLEDGWYRAQDSWIKNNVRTKELLNKYGADGIIYMFFFNTDYSNKSRSCTTDHTNEDFVLYEFINIYLKYNGYKMRPPAYAHEILHAFGAPDLYYSNKWIPQKYVKELERTNSKDIMFSVYDSNKITNKFTDLDAYYVGIAPRPAVADKWSLGKSEHDTD